MRSTRNDAALNAHLAKVVFCCVPHHGRASIDPGPILLHDDARDDVFVGFVEGLKLLEAVVDNGVCPVRHLL